ncbi:zinc-binding dehydrogenase [Streptomyces sp. NRRL F-5635]|uniref:zinc-binding dehydrogenase n=1 Tax=Streptomyces sp. NRRL F-5635 TaxID=1463865 RepID=UPI00099C801B|nr:zinc-binding dehydrogenase [Streptomyces sp. NRRL F-5635]
MKRWQANEFGAPDTVLEKAEVPLPEPGPDEARVRVLAASVGLPDLMMVQGRYPLVASAPVSPGQEIVGVVDKPGPGYPFPAGTRIMGNSRADIAIGGLAEYTLSPAPGAMPVPAELTGAQAAGFPGSYHVAHVGLMHRAALRKGETLLVLGGSGRTGSAAIQLGKAMGATVIATARNKDKARFCRLQGADHVIDLSEADLAETVLELSGGHGADVIYDTVGGDTYEQATRAVGRGGAFSWSASPAGNGGNPTPSTSSSTTTRSAEPLPSSARTRNATSPKRPSPSSCATDRSPRPSPRRTGSMRCLPPSTAASEVPSARPLSSSPVRPISRPDTTSRSSFA